MKHVRVFVISLILLGVCSVRGTVKGGFSKIWDGMKDVASGSWEVVASPFKRGEEKKESKDTAKGQKEVEKHHEK